MLPVICLQQEDNICIFLYTVYLFWVAFLRMLFYHMSELK